MFSGRREGYETTGGVGNFARFDRIVFFTIKHSKNI